MLLKTFWSALARNQRKPSRSSCAQIRIFRLDGESAEIHPLLSAEVYQCLEQDSEPEVEQPPGEHARLD